MAAFRGYADYMATEPFISAMEDLMALANKETLAYMCSEAVWWSCHRSLVSDYLEVRGWKVVHLMAPGKTTEHPYTKPAKVVNGDLSYKEEDLFNN